MPEALREIKRIQQERRARGQEIIKKITHPERLLTKLHGNKPVGLGALVLGFIAAHSACAMPVSGEAKAAIGLGALGLLGIALINLKPYFYPSLPPKK